MQPNMELRAVYLKNGSSTEARAKVEVPKIEDRLKIEIVPAKQQYAPGEQGQVNFKVSDGNGNPVQTELCISIVDQGVFLLSKDKTPKAFDVLHQDLTNRVTTYLSEYFPLEIVARRTAPESIDPIDSLVTPRESTDPPVTQNQSPIVKVRKDFHDTAGFRDTADWRASLITDENGLASITVPFSENLTTWRITARGQTVDAKAGEARANVMVTQDIVTRLSHPAFLVRGDRFQMRGIVNNNRSTATTGAFKFGLTGLNALASVETNLGFVLK
jgi:uncharacterized protein YfaS (alpha-2-macroglobulin family)